MALLARRYVPNLNLPEACGIAARGDQRSSIGRECEAMNARSESGQARYNSGFTVQNDLMVAGDREQFAIGRPCECRNQRRSGVDCFLALARWNLCNCRRIVLAAFRDPPLKELDLLVAQGPSA